MISLDSFFERHPNYQEWASDELWQHRVELWSWYGSPGSYGVKGKLPQWIRSPVPSSQDLWFYARDLIWWYAQQAGEMASQNLGLALTMAREIPTLECCREAVEAFSAIAARTPPRTPRTEEVFLEAYRCAWSAKEPFLQIRYSGRVLEAEIAAGRIPPKHQVLKLLEEASKMEHTLNRAQSLFEVWSAIFPLGREYRAKVQRSAIAAALAARSWKSPVLLQDIVHKLSSDDPEAALVVFQRMPESRIKRQVQASLSIPRKS